MTKYEVKLTSKDGYQLLITVMDEYVNDDNIEEEVMNSTLVKQYNYEGYRYKISSIDKK